MRKFEKYNHWSSYCIDSNNYDYDMLDLISKDER